MEINKFKKNSNFLKDIKAQTKKEVSQKSMQEV
jgi:hypothetical protein